MRFKVPKGTRDLLPEDAIKMQEIMQKCRDVFEKYGFEPLITPAFESFEFLSAKGGLGEGVKDEIYYFKDKSDRELGLRFDLTMPLARVASNNPQIPKPFKRYTIDTVWRYDNPQAKRWREFRQADVDIVGSTSLDADVEVIAVACSVLEKLGFKDKDFTIRISDRRILEGYIKSLGIENYLEIFRTIDKLDKLGREGVEKELKNKNIKPSKIKKLMDFILDIPQIFPVDPSFAVAEQELTKMREEITRKLSSYGYDKYLNIDFGLVRGLEYYTGLIFEINLNLGSNVTCGGGGRYDNLIKTVGGVDLPATGISLGLDRILEVMKENKMFKNKKSKPRVFVANVDDNDTIMNNVIKIVQELRENNINAQINLTKKNLTKQLEYANNLNIPFCIIVGKKEIESESKQFKLKDMKKKSEKELTLKKIIEQLKLYS